MNRPEPQGATQAGEAGQSEPCRCFFAHPQSNSQRAEITSALRVARHAGDAVGMVIGLAQLTQPCPASAAKEAR
ncbi:hypothetical protein ACWFR1_22935 [Streptomyces sp. NPDC055103]